MAIIGNSIISASSPRLYLIKGLDQCTELTGGWSGLAIWRASGDANYSQYGRAVPTVDTDETGQYITVARTQTSTSGGGYDKRGAYVTANAINLSEYSSLTLVYDIIAWGTTTANRVGLFSLVARTSQPTESGYQLVGSSAGIYQEIKYGNGTAYSGAVDASTKLENQSITLDISSWGSVYVTLGFNQNNGGTAFRVTIKSIYAKK